MSAPDVFDVVGQLAGLLGPQGKLVGIGVQIAKKALEDHGDPEAAEAHLKALILEDIQSAARAKWGG
jgi:hypothetical protein